MMITRHPGGAWSAPLGLIGMLLLVASVERGAARCSLPLFENSATSWKYSLEQARREGREAQILCFGSSLTKFGVLPTIVERRTGKRAYNLAVYGGRIASSYYFFKKALDAGARPEAVVLDIHDGPVPAEDAAKLSEGIASNRRNWPEVLRPSEVVELGLASKDVDFLTSTLLAELLPTLKSRHEIRGAVLSVLDGLSPGNRAINLMLLRNWNVNRGAQVMPTANPPLGLERPPIDRSAEAPPLPAGRFVANEFASAYRRKFLDLAAHRGVTVYWLLPPLSPAVLTSQRTDGYERDATELARAELARYPNVVVVDARVADFGAGAFIDITHLNEFGATFLSDALGRVIAGRPSSRGAEGRWVALPKYRPLEADGRVEDLARSQVAVSTGLAGRPARRPAAAETMTR